MNKMAAIKRVVLSERHLRPGRTKHSLCDSQGTREFPPFTSLDISQFPGDPGYFLMHLCENGECADSWHQTLDDAFHQAEIEFEVQREEWIEVSEPS
jgi:hypothetical protein